MPKEAKILNIPNNKKATEIKNYILDKFERVLVDTMNEYDNNCLFESILCQLANRRFMFKDTQHYNAQNLRLQTVAFMAKNYEFIYNKVMHSITGSFIQWLLDMMDPQTEGDTAALIGMRYLLQVNKF